MEFIGIGTDIIEVERIALAYDKHQEAFLKRHFTQKEIDYCRKYQDIAPRLAGHFAAKEAIGKALRIGVAIWTEIEIVHDANGAPLVELKGKLKQQFGALTICLSISHCKSYATANALAFRSVNG